MGVTAFSRQPTFIILPDGTGYWIHRQGRRVCVCVDLPNLGDMPVFKARALLQDRYRRAWWHARVSGPLSGRVSEPLDLYVAL